MKTLHTTYRISDLGQSLAFYRALGYELVGARGVGDEGASLVALKFPAEEVVSLQLAYHPGERRIQFGGFVLERGRVDPGVGFSHVVVSVDDLSAALARLADHGVAAESEQQPSGPDGPKTSWLSDPDGYRIELVQWPDGHPDGMTVADCD